MATAAPGTDSTITITRSHTPARKRRLLSGKKQSNSLVRIIKIFFNFNTGSSSGYSNAHQQMASYDNQYESAENYAYDSYGSNNYDQNDSYGK